ncbi:MAG: hypothetical protein GY716_10180 [bacterium]|nr:hypothetical protein [bacterium]
MGSHADIDKHVRTYMIVFASLLVLTGATVGAAMLDFSPGLTIAVALFIATIKGSLVACFFMHLISERKLILWVLLLTISFFFVLLLVPMWTSISDQALS